MICCSVLICFDVNHVNEYSVGFSRLARKDEFQRSVSVRVWCRGSWAAHSFLFLMYRYMYFYLALIFSIYPHVYLCLGFLAI